ncbi:MAG: ABC transporter permease [Candidatus Taylorbacteria bacterium]|nr:ABC transporter permease [Candidatus Taylorbacteria bacterium]
MFWTKIKRTIRAGFVSFWRNGYVSLASVLVMTVTLTVLTSIMLTGALLDSTLTSVKNKVDINVYFVKGANEEDIAVIGKALRGLPQVQQVEYISSEDALTQFRERHKDDELTLQALDELGTNPLGASFNIKAQDPSQYEGIVKFLEDAKGGNSGSIIDRINYTKNKQAIDALNRIIAASSRLGSAIIIFFVVVAILITFNTVRLAIYIFREEISVMRLVGASEMYIRGPFLTVGIMYGVVSGVLTLLILYPIMYWVGPITESFGTGLNLFAYFSHNFGYLFLVVVGTGVLLGTISSYLAVRKYLKI